MQGLGAGKIQTVSQTYYFPKHFFYTPGTQLLQRLPSGVEIFGNCKARSSELHEMGGNFGGAHRRLRLVLSKAVSRRIGL